MSVEVTCIQCELPFTCINSQASSRKFCSTCNVGLGMFKDSIALLDLAADYLKEHTK